MKTTSLEDFKKSCSQLAAKAISDYENAIQVIHNYNKNVVEIIDANVSTVRSSSIWERLLFNTKFVSLNASFMSFCNNIQIVEFPLGLRLIRLHQTARPAKNI